MNTLSRNSCTGLARWFSESADGSRATNISRKTPFKKWSIITPDGKTETQIFATERPNIVATRLAPDGRTSVCNEITRAAGKVQFGLAGNAAISLRTLGKDDAVHDLDIKGQYALCAISVHLAHVQVPEASKFSRMPPFVL
jgi:hypothetical protein